MIHGVYYEFNANPFDLTISFTLSAPAQLIEVCEISLRHHNELGLIHNKETPLTRHNDAEEKLFSSSSDYLITPNINNQKIKIIKWMLIASSSLLVSISVVIFASSLYSDEITYLLMPIGQCKFS